MVENEWLLGIVDNEREKLDYVESLSLCGIYRGWSGPLLLGKIKGFSGKRGRDGSQLFFFVAFNSFF